MLFQALDGNWVLRQVGTEENYTAKVPGCVHTALIQAGKIADPMYGDNENKCQWVHEKDWAFSRTFVLDESLLDCDKLYLECDGLDTIAKVTLNGSLVADTDNMFMAYRFDVKSLLIPGENKIDVSFKSPSEYVKPFIAIDPLRDAKDAVQGSFYMRKSPFQWGWDWGPKLPTIGIWKSIRLAGYNSARIDNLWIRQRHENGKVWLDITASLEKYSDAGCRVILTINHPNANAEVIKLDTAGCEASTCVEIQNPELWWPNGHGAQPLYDIKAEVECGGEIVHSKSERIGLRTVEVKFEDDDYGKGFKFVVNGAEVFCKGANWVPADSLPTTLNETRYRHMVSSAAKANMNMLRVWGGGFYESDIFYNLCDEYGILVWQDFMFACRLYPTHTEFLGNVEREAKQVVERLRNRTCIAMWCGNNEIEAFLYEWWVDERIDERRAQHNAIFEHLIRKIVSETDPDRFYWRSSPNSGEPFDNPDDLNRGDSHYWAVWHKCLPFTNYREHYHRFTSEFGMQSFPCYETCKSYAPEDEMNATSYTMEHHQRNASGNSVILNYLSQTLRFPKDFKMLCYTSQLIQGEAMRYGIEHWRRNRGRCMGALYWQYNDCWPVQSWSGIDYYGRWKALQYFARRFYSPVMMSVRDESTSAEIHVTNDTLKPVPVEVKWSLEKLDGTVISCGHKKCDVSPESDIMVCDLDFSKELSGDMRREAVLVAELTANGVPGGMSITPFVPSKHLKLPAANISIAHGRDEAGAYVDVSSDLTARYVCLEVPGVDCIFSDNFFDLPAGRKARVRIESEIDAGLLSSLMAYSLRDSY